MTEGRKVRVLFVCGGNTCRSPMAVALARKLIGPQIEAESAGVDPGYSVTGEAVRTMADEFGIDISSHRPRAVGTVAPEHFDYIVTLDPYVRKRFLAQFPSLGDRVVSWTVEDPYGKGMDKYLESAQALCERLQQFARDLRREGEV